MKKPVWWQGYASLLVALVAGGVGIACFATAFHFPFWLVWVGVLLLVYASVELVDALRKW